jgi:hypothetical protein
MRTRQGENRVGIQRSKFNKRLGLKRSETGIPNVIDGISIQNTNLIGKAKYTNAS